MRARVDAKLDDSVRGPYGTSDKPDPRGLSHRYVLDARWVAGMQSNTDISAGLFVDLGLRDDIAQGVAQLDGGEVKLLEGGLDFGAVADGDDEELIGVDILLCDTDYVG